MRALPSVPVTPEFLPFAGGLDTVSPHLQVKSGYAREAQNWELDINGGYRPITGYERRDGRARPSAGAYSILAVTLSVAATVGETVTGGTSAATGVVIAVASGQLILTATTGTFESENITGGSTAVGTCVGPAITDGASTALLHAQYKNLAADHYRALIGAVPGSGNVLGVVTYGDVDYAFRNNAGGTAVDMYKTTAGGWSQVTFGEEVSFTNANTNVGDGDTLTQGGVTATIARVVLETGSLASGVNTGRLIITGRAGGNFAAGAATSTGSGALTISGAQTAITFAVPTGRFEFVVHNFSGAASSRKLYGCDGKNRAFEFDGTTLVPISTGMASDAPSHIAVHKKQLFLSYGAMLQHSRPGFPYEWNAITGAGAIAMGDDITGMKGQPGSESGGAMAIFTRNGLGTLYGSGVSDWQLVQQEEEAGAYANTIQHATFTIMLDDRGLMSLSTSQNYGNFASATLSKLVQDWLADRRSSATASCIARDKNQYRLFFSDGSALYVTIDNRKIVGMMPQLLADPVRCIWSSELSDGSERIIFGSSNGYVYEMERGTSFDGDAIETYLHLVFNHSGSPLFLKTYRGVSFEVEGDGYAEFSFSYELGYGTTELEQPGQLTVTNALRASNWDTAIFDQFYFDGRNLLPTTATFVGTGENFSFRFRSNSDYYSPIRISGAVIQYTPRRRMRIG